MGARIAAVKELEVVGHIVWGRLSGGCSACLRCLIIRLMYVYIYTIATRTASGTKKITGILIVRVHRWHNGKPRE